jgi:hypothetical protein
MIRKYEAKTIATLLVITISGCSLCYEAYSEPHASSRRDRSKFEPAKGKTILFIGQTKGEIEDYAIHAGLGAPPGYMVYTGLEKLEGLSEPYVGKGCAEAGVQDLTGLSQEFPGSAAQIGLYVVGELPAIDRGELDGQIRKLAGRLRELRRPVFLRVGYEFDGPWNAYHPEEYRHAFRRIVSIFRGEKIGGERVQQVDNVAFVWHSGAWKTYGNFPFSAWYPGDRYVDWVGISWFGLKSEDANKTAEDARAGVLSFARKHHKPLMIAESTPRRYFSPDHPDSWDRWYAPIFHWIEQNRIEGFSYINQDWTAQQMWGNPDCKSEMDWGESRIQVERSTVLPLWRQQIATSRFLKPGEELFRSIKFVSSDVK